MKIGIVTIYDAYNYGSFLQAFALQEFLINEGHEVYILDFSVSLKSRIARKYLAKNIKRTVLKLHRYFVYRKDWKLLNIKRGNKIEQIDLMIVGSDEVWNIDNESIEHIKQFYGIDCAAKQIIAYAPSLGYATGTSYKKYPEFVNGIKNNISAFYMRDAFTEEFVKRIIKKETRKVSDPTILLYDRWEEFMQGYPMQIEKYMIYYSYLDDTPFKEFIKKFAKENDLKLIVVGFDYLWCDDQIIVTPRQFLSVLKHAQYVVTSTYHGTVFSTLLKKKIVVIHPSIKVIDYLEQIGLKKISFLESGYDNFSKFLLDDIDYDLVWDKLNTLREFSVHCINENLNK